MRSLTVTEIRDRQNRRPEFRPYVGVRRFDQRYRVTVRLDGLEHTHQQGFTDRSVAWDLVKRVRLHLERGHDLNLENWETEGGEGPHSDDDWPSKRETSSLPIEITVPIQTGLVTLEGYLGTDPEDCLTKARTVTHHRTYRQQFVFEHGGRRLTDPHDLVKDEEEFDLHHAPRGYATFSLASHHWKDGRQQTTWHRIIAWNTDRDHFGLFRLGKGDLVEVSGRPSTFTTKDGRFLEQLELVRFRLIRRKLRRSAEV